MLGRDLAREPPHGHAQPMRHWIIIVGVWMLMGCAPTEAVQACRDMCQHMADQDSRCNGNPPAPVAAACIEQQRCASVRGLWSPDTFPQCLADLDTTCTMPASCLHAFGPSAP